MNRRYLRFTLYLIFIVSCMAQAMAQSAPTITSITGSSDGVGVLNGRWTGQPSHAPATASNKYLGFLVWDTYPYGSVASNPYYWDINGTNFGTATGKVWLTHRPSGPSQAALSIVSWSATRIRVKPVSVSSSAAYTFTSDPIRINVQTAAGSSVGRDDSLVGIIKSRGYGQCTWLVARTRLSLSLAVPLPSAYSTTGTIPAVGSNDNGYRPAKGDALTYGLNHVAIITTAPTSTTNTDGSITWSFTVREMNTRWDEVEVSSTRTYKLSASNLYGTRRVVSGIGTNASSTWVATGYYR